VSFDNKLVNKKIIRCLWCNEPVHRLTLDFFKTGIAFCNDNCRRKFKEMQLEASIEYEEMNRISKEIARDNDFCKERYGD